MTAQARPTRPRGFAPWSPRPETLALVQAVNSLLHEYCEHLPLTIRQVFYRLVGTADYPKTERGYARLCETINRARRARLILFEAIRDDGGARYAPTFWSDPDEWLMAVRDEAQRYRYDRQEGQPVRLWLLTEAAGMAPMVARVADPYGVPVLSSGGFDSLTAKHDLARELAIEGRAEVLHIGDRDPSGEHIFSSLAEDVGAMVAALGGDPPIFTRLAVTEAQAVAMNLPTAPPKPTDNRRFHGETVQAEAIPPDVLAGIVKDAIETRQDADLRDWTLAREAEARAWLADRLEVTQ